MPTEDFIIKLFCLVDDKMLKATKHSQAMLFPSEVVTLALLFVLKGRGKRAFYRWLENNWLHFFLSLPYRTRLFRWFNTHRFWVEQFMADPSLIGVIDSYGIELIHPRREGPSAKQIGKKGLSNQRWIVGGKLCLLLNHLGLVVGWDVDTANVYDGSAFQNLVEAVAEGMLVFADPHFAKSGWHPPNLKICAKGTWNDNMMIRLLA